MLWSIIIRKKKGEEEEEEEEEEEGKNPTHCLAYVMLMAG